VEKSERNEKKTGASAEWRHKETLRPYAGDLKPMLLPKLIKLIFTSEGNT